MSDENIPITSSLGNNNTEKIVKPFIPEPSFIHKNLPTILLVLAIGLGVTSGLFLAKRGVGSSMTNSSSNESANNESGGVVVGSSDTKTFKDCAQGKLIKNDGKITTEGSHKLIRDGGESQSVYITSSIVDLDQFVGKNVSVCGETNQAQKAGWLMDVGRVKIL